MTYLFPLVRKPRDDILSSHSIAITSLNRHYSILIVTFGWLFYFTQRYRPIFVFSELFSEPTALFSVVFSVVVSVVFSLVSVVLSVVLSAATGPPSSVPENSHRDRYLGMTAAMTQNLSPRLHGYIWPRIKS